MTDAPVDLDGLGADLAAIAVTLGMLCAEPEHRGRLARIGRAITELRAARAPVEAWKVAWERVCPEAARAARLGWFDGMNKREGFEAGYLAAQSRAAAPAGERSPRPDRESPEGEALMAELETAYDAGLRILRAAQPREFYEELCNRVAGEIEARDKAVALRVLAGIRDAANAALKGKGLSMSPAEAIANAWQAAFAKYQEKP